MYLEIFLVDFAVIRVFLGISWDFVEIPEFRGSATARNIRSPDHYRQVIAWHMINDSRQRTLGISIVVV